MKPRMSFMCDGHTPTIMRGASYSTFMCLYSLLSPAGSSSELLHELKSLVDVLVHLETSIIKMATQKPQVFIWSTCVWIVSYCKANSLAVLSLEGVACVQNLSRLEMQFKHPIYTSCVCICKCIIPSGVAVLAISLSQSGRDNRKNLHKFIIPSTAAALVVSLFHTRGVFEGPAEWGQNLARPRK